MKFYVDTSVWGGHEDKEVSECTIPFIEQAKQGKFIKVVSDVTLAELDKAPTKVKDLVSCRIKSRILARQKKISWPLK